VIAAATQLVHDTVRVMVHDTTAVHDTLTEFMGRVPGILDVQVHDTLGGKDWMTWAVQLVVALGAAYLGAWLGGRSARDAATAAIGAEWEIERRHAIERLWKRIQSNLRRVELLSAGCADHKSQEPLDPEVGEELEVVWNLYYRVAEPIFTVGIDDLSERLDAFFVRTHTLAETIKTLEARARDVETVGHETEKYRDTAEARRRLPEERKAVLTKIAAVGADAAKLLAEVRALEKHAKLGTPPMGGARPA
jgi:hypothetical protein